MNSRDASSAAVQAVQAVACRLRAWGSGDTWATAGQRLVVIQTPAAESRHVLTNSRYRLAIASTHSCRSILFARNATMLSHQIVRPTAKPV